MQVYLMKFYETPDSSPEIRVARTIRSVRAVLESRNEYLSEEQTSELFSQGHLELDNWKEGFSIVITQTQAV